MGITLSATARFYGLVRRHFSELGVQKFKRAELIEFVNTLEEKVPHFNCLATNPDLKSETWGYYRVPTTRDIMNAHRADMMKDPRGRKAGIRFENGYHTQRKAAAKQAAPVLTEEMIAERVAQKPRNNRGHFLGRQGIIQEFIDQGYVWG